MKRLVLLAIACSLPLQAQGQGNSAHHQTNAAQTKQQITAAPQPSIPPVVQADIHRLANALEAANTKEKSKTEQYQDRANLRAQKRMAKAASKMFWVGLFEALVTLIGVVLVGATVHFTRRAVTEAKRAANESQRAADAAHKQIEVMRTASEDELRPYVSVTLATYKSSGQEPHIVLSCTNSGQTPASHFDIEAGCEAVIPDEDTEIIIPEKLNPRVGYSSIGGNQTVTCYVGLGDMKDKISAVKRMQKAGEDAVFVLYGRIFYGDVFGNEYMSEFIQYTKKLDAQETKMGRPRGRRRQFVLIKKTKEDQA